MLVAHYCKKCGKEFYPTPAHVYRDSTGSYCCWTCFDYHRKNDKRHRKKVEVLDSKRQVITEYPGASYAAKVMGCEAADIRRACRSGAFCKGYFWRYADENKEKGEN